MSKHDDPEGGYGRPPVRHQFKKGQSGNPRGRPKGSQNLRAIINEELEQTLTVTVDGRRQRMSKVRIMMRRLVDNAVKGDPKAIATVFKLADALGSPDPEYDAKSEITAEEDEAIFTEHVMKKLERGGGS